MTDLLLYRLANLDPSTIEGRTVHGVLVPYGEPADIEEGGRRYTEVFERGAFSRSIRERSHKLRLFTQHDTRRLPIGRPTELEERDDGLHGAFVISETRDGDDALTAIRDGLAGGFSVGFRPVRNSHDKNNVMRRVEAALIEVSLVSEPAYAGALVAGVRSLDPHAPTPLRVADARRRRLNL